VPETRRQPQASVGRYSSLNPTEKQVKVLTHQASTVRETFPNEEHLWVIVSVFGRMKHATGSRAIPSSGFTDILGLANYRSVYGISDCVTLAFRNLGVKCGTRRVSPISSRFWPSTTQEQRGLVAARPVFHSWRPTSTSILFYTSCYGCLYSGTNWSVLKEIFAHTVKGPEKEAFQLVIKLQVGEGRDLFTNLEHDFLHLWVDMHAGLVVTTVEVSHIDLTTICPIHNGFRREALMILVSTKLRLMILF
jgi:hypothetical protein